ncbi:hypothetical protein ACHAXA_010774 [Cyclostephanos tholiformis]|uniref:Uncharacterized protein n=1 Tax=Cyclostephanos tholiformis TaxID=382380 RepID=A0ABD3R4V4_9STRA
MSHHLPPFLLAILPMAGISSAFTCRSGMRASHIHPSFDDVPHHSSYFGGYERPTLCAGGDDAGGGGDGGRGGGGYKFGDITKSLIGGSVEKITGKPYEFGDLARAIDSSVKDKVCDLTGNDDYEFGDLSRWVDGKIRVEVSKFTNKDNYQFGDLTKEILKRMASGQYAMDDIFILLKALAMLGASISPVAGFLPVRMLVETLNFSLANDVAGKVTSTLAMELDKRLKKSLLGDENYKLGDATKRTIADAINNYTGKESYEFGDVTRKVMSKISDRVNTPNDRQMIGMSAEIMEPSIADAFDKWDILSGTDTKYGLDKIEKYVKLIEQERQGGTNV